MGLSKNWNFCEILGLLWVLLCLKFDQMSLFLMLLIEEDMDVGDDDLGR